MSKLTRESLQKLRDENKQKFYDNKETTILVGMGSCGIAAGARETMKSLEEEINKMGIKNVNLKITGCMGTCMVEPTVEIISPDMPRVIYGKVTSDVVQKIVDRHLLNKMLVYDLIYDKPAIDIVR
jgi:NADP-reducing hydrogenase subunit HndB